MDLNRQRFEESSPLALGCAHPAGIAPMLNYLAPILLLLGSNVFMTFAWYGHLKFTDRPLWIVIAVSWGIAFFEYCLQVPANRWGYGRFTAYQLKITQEVITLLVFMVFSALWLGEPPRWNYLVAFVLVLAAVGFAFLPRG
jgi:uncharacterized protein (DUF486 family)